MVAMIYLSITQKSSQRAQQPFVKARRLSTRLEKAKRVVLVQSKRGPAEAVYETTVGESRAGYSVVSGQRAQW